MGGRMMDKITLWRGKPLSDMTKDELIEAIQVMGRLSAEQQEMTRKIESLQRR